MMMMMMTVFLVVDLVCWSKIQILSDIIPMINLQFGAPWIEVGLYLQKPFTILYSWLGGPQSHSIQPQ